MHEAYQRILKALNLEKHLTARQIAKLLYPNEEANKRYHRVAKNLQYLKGKDLLKSKSYGLGKEDFWSLRRHPIIKDLDYSPPRAEVHTFKYEHEKDCAEVFVHFALTGELYGWEEHVRISKGIIPDRIAHFQNETLYIEVERSERDRVTDKIHNYQSYYRETKEPFKVLFVVKRMRDWKTSSHYQFVELGTLIGVPNDTNALNQ